MNDDHLSIPELLWSELCGDVFSRVDAYMFIAHAVRQQEDETLIVSLRALAEQWGWCKDAVSRFLRRVQALGYLEVSESGHNTMIRLPSREMPIGKPGALFPSEAIKPRRWKANAQIEEEINMPPELSSERARASWNEWLLYRKREKRQPLKPMSQRATLKRWAAFGEDRFVAAIEFSISSGYLGLFEQNKRDPRMQRQIDRAAQLAAVAVELENEDRRTEEQELSA